MSTAAAEADRTPVATVAPAPRRATPAWLPGTIVLLVLGLDRIRGRELWLDEAFSLGATHHLGSTVASTGGTMALYYTLLTPWSWLGQSAAWLRLPSLAAVAGAIVVTTALVRRTSGLRVARWTGLIAATSPTLVYCSSEARSYGLVCLLTAVAWYALDRTVADDGRGWPAVLATSLVLLPAAHGLGIVQVAMVGAATLVARPSRRVLTLVVLASFGALALVAVMFGAGVSEVGNWIDPLTVGSAVGFAGALVHTFWPMAAVLAIVGLVGMATVVARPATTPIERLRRVALVLWGPGSLVVILALSLVRPSYLPRYGSAACLAIAALVAIGLDRIELDSVRRLAPVALLGALVLTQVGATYGHPWGEAGRIVADGQRSGDQIVFGRADARMPFEAAWEQLGPDLVPTVVGPSAPLGDFDRFGSSDDLEVLVRDVDPDRRVWLVDQEYEHQASVGDLEAELVDRGYRVVDTWDLPGATHVVLLAPEP